MTNSSLPKATPEQLRELAYQVLTTIDDAILESIGAEAARDEILKAVATFLASIELPEKPKPGLIDGKEQYNYYQAGYVLCYDRFKAIINKIVEELTK